jgi:hypothetical protein
MAVVNRMTTENNEGVGMKFHDLMYAPILSADPVIRTRSIVWESGSVGFSNEPVRTD